LRNRQQIVVTDDGVGLAESRLAQGDQGRASTTPSTFASFVRRGVWPRRTANAGSSLVGAAAGAAV